MEKAFSSGYKYVVLEAPTGTGKTPVAVAAALSLGSSYICTSTKELQTQYHRDFRYVKIAKGKQNFTCNVLASQLESELVRQVRQARQGFFRTSRVTFLNSSSHVCFEFDNCES